MAHIAPFRALRYNPLQVNLPQVLTQPYDKITPEMQERYYAASPYNLVRIILGKPEPSDHAGSSVYTRAAASLQEWRRQGVLQPDAEPSIYLYCQRFTVPGGSQELERRGFIALGRVEDYSAQVVFRHEQTLSKPKADRLDLLRATRAHFGQIFMLYSDPAGEIDKALAPAGKPDVEVGDEYGVLHRLWRISEPEVIQVVRGKMRDKKLIIADGHHRYETAVNYRNERRSQAGTSIPEAPYEMVMMTLVNMDASGLLILPTHRVVHGLGSFSAQEFAERAAQYFSVEEVDASIDAVRAQERLRETGRPGTALLAVTKEKAFLLDKPKAMGTRVFDGFSLRQQSLDVVQLHKCLLESALGISEEAIRNQQNIRYVRDANEAIEQARQGKANVAFLMNPVRMQQVRDIAFAGEVLPQKSTDFYPKLLSGLTICSLE